MAVIRYAQWRDHESQRIQTNDTVMGLLAGSKLAAQTLNLTAGSALTVSQIFPQVEHIGRFNLPVDRARAVLGEAESLLGILAVPQIIGLHEALFQGMCKLLVAEGLMSNGQAQNIKSASMHAAFEEAIPPNNFTAVTVELFHLIRVARNTHIHNGGRADARLTNRIASLSADALPTWTHITGASFPEYAIDEPVRLGLPELVGILAITQRLAEEANAMLQSAISKERWADMLISDWRPNKRPGNRRQWIRTILGLARIDYAPVGLDAGDVDSALTRAGM